MGRRLKGNNCAAISLMFALSAFEPYGSVSQPPGICSQLRGGDAVFFRAVSEHITVVEANTRYTRQIFCVWTGFYHDFQQRLSFFTRSLAGICQFQALLPQIHCFAASFPLHGSGKEIHSGLPDPASSPILVVATSELAAVARPRYSAKQLHLIPAPHSNVCT